MSEENHQERTINAVETEQENGSSDTEKFSFTSLAAIRRRLLDLTGRNNLLNFRHPKTSCVRIIDELPNQIYSVLDSNGKFTFIPVPEPTEQELLNNGFIKVDPKTGKKSVSNYPTAEQWAKIIGLSTSYDLPEPRSTATHSKHQDTNLQTLFYAPELETRLRSIRGAAETSIEESGSNILYLALGFLEWYESRDSDVARLSPLFTLPVQLERTDLDKKAGAYRYTLQLKDDGLITNVTLREKLSNDFGLILPTIDEDTTPESYFELVQDTVIKHQPRWKLRRQASLVLLNFTKQAMYEDLDPDNWPASANIEQHPLIQKFFSSQTEDNGDVCFTYETEHPIDDIADIHEQYPLIYDADSSQHSAIIDIVSGKNLVIEGPPGSGKSQTITNLIAASISNGLRVLFVAEKMAALNVVKHRLDKAGLGDFCLELHSHKTNKQKILNDLSSRLSKQEQFYSPQSFDADIERFERLKHKLNEYVAKVNGIWKNTGLTIHQILQKTTRLREQYGIDPSKLKIEGINGENLTLARQNELADYAHMLANIYDQVSQQAENANIENHYWHGIENTALAANDVQTMIISLSSWSDSLHALSVEWNKILSGLGLNTTENVALFEIESFLFSSQSLPRLIGGESFEDLDFINSHADDIQDWLDIYKDLHADIVDLAKDFHIQALYKTSTPDMISESTKLLKSFGVSGTVTLSSIVDDNVSIGDAISKLKELEIVFSKIVPNAPQGIRSLFNLSFDGIGELLTFIRVVNELPSELWRFRNEIFDNRELDTLIPTLKKRIDAITPYYTKLKNDVNLSIIPASDTLKDYQSTLSNGGIFKWLSSDWRAARNAVLALSSKTAPNKKQFISLLPDLIFFAEEQEEISRINKDNPALGDQFKGIETPLDRIESIRNWYKKVRNEYGSGFGARVGLGNELLKIDKNFAQALVDESNKVFAKSATDLMSILATLHQRYTQHELTKHKDKTLIGVDGPLTKLSQDVSMVVNQFGRIVKSAELSLDYLNKCAQKTQDILEESSEWENSPFKSRIRAFEESLSLDPSHFSQLHLSVVRNTLNATKAICSNKYSYRAFKMEASVRQYEKLKNSSEIIASAQVESVTKKEIFQRIGNVNLDKWLASTDSTINSIISRNQSATSHPHWLNSWLDYILLKSKLYQEGFTNIIQVLESSDMSTSNLQNIVSLVISHQLSTEILEENPELASFTGLEQTANQQRFREYDQKLLDLQRKRVAYRASRVTPPNGVSSGKAGDYTEVSLIKRESAKKTKHIAVRSLIKRAGKAIQSLKPCFMMSPMSVAQYLEPGKFNFDLVIMDEASQIRPEDALGAIARGSKLVVVGDPKQLPPTNFFNKVIEDESDEDVVGLQESESILESVMPMFSTRRLRWHYRSKHESLIAFSNKHFYDSDLILFPSPFKNSPDFGVKLSLIGNGRFMARRNVEEASELAKAVAEHLIKKPGESIGLVAMNSEQRDELERQLDQLSKDDPLLYMALESNKAKDEPLFIKNLENVQGDERDVIFISMTYGPEKIGGKVMQRFGPINSDVGWRRLNVLFTRSKKRMHIFSSMTSGDIVLTANSSSGVKALKAFLEFAEKGILHNSIQTGKEPDSDFEISVINALKKHGYDCEPQLGVAGFFLDIAVKDPAKPGRFLLGIECDGATYHSAKSARDRDRLRQEILESLGWKIHRIWSTDWFKNPEVQLKPILNKLDSLRSEPSPDLPQEELSSIEVLGTQNEGLAKDPSRVKTNSDGIALEMADIGSVIELGEFKYKKTEFGYERIREESQSTHTISLRDRLKEFDENHIRAIYPDTDENTRLLRPEMLEALLEHLPCSKSEFLENIPAFIRTATSSSEAKLLEPVLKIIADYS